MMQRVLCRGVSLCTTLQRGYCDNVTEISSNCYFQFHTEGEIEYLIMCMYKNYGKTWCHPQNRKYIMCFNTSRQLIQKIWWWADVWLLRYAYGQTDITSSSQYSTRYWVGEKICSTQPKVHFLEICPDTRLVAKRKVVVVLMTVAACLVALWDVVVCGC